MHVRYHVTLFGPIVLDHALREHIRAVLENQVSLICKM